MSGSGHMRNFRLGLAGTSFAPVKTQQTNCINLELRLLIAASQGYVCHH